MGLWSRRLFVTFIGAVLCAGQATVSPAQGNRNGKLTLKIHDTFPGSASGVRGDGVRHETPTDPFSFYVDYTLSGGDTCVTAKINSSGLGFIYLDRRGNTSDCAASQIPPLTPRTFVLQLPASACTALGLANAPCTLRMNPGDGEEPLTHPRIRMDTLYSPQAKTPVAFLFLYNGVSYEVRSDADVSFGRSGNLWTLGNNATGSGGRSFSLWRITSPGGNIASGFDLWFSLIANKP